MLSGLFKLDPVVSIYNHIITISLNLGNESILMSRSIWIRSRAVQQAWSVGRYCQARDHVSSAIESLARPIVHDLRPRQLIVRAVEHVLLHIQHALWAIECAPKRKNMFDCPMEHVLWRHRPCFGGRDDFQTFRNSKHQQTTRKVVSRFFS